MYKDFLLFLPIFVYTFLQTTFLEKRVFRTVSFHYNTQIWFMLIIPFFQTSVFSQIEKFINHINFGTLNYSSVQIYVDEIYDQ